MWLGEAANANTRLKPFALLPRKQFGPSPRDDKVHLKAGQFICAKPSCTCLLANIMAKKLPTDITILHHYVTRCPRSAIEAPAKDCCGCAACCLRVVTCSRLVEPDVAKGHAVC
jgi:hypothetical protein